MAQTNNSGSETSLKQLFQSMIPAGDELMEGTVIQTTPLKIQMTGDDKLIISDRITIIPWHLTDYKTRATYRKMDGTLDSRTKNDGSHADPIGGKHVHHGDNFNLYNGIIVVHNALRKGDKLHILALNHGKLYYVLDRVAGQEVDIVAESVYIPLPVTTVQEAAEPPTKTYRLDLDAGRILGMVDGQEAVRQAIRKAIITPRWKCLIYDNQYGSEIEAAVIQSKGRATTEYIKSVIPGFIRDALRPDTRITQVSNFVFAFTPEEKQRLFPDIFEPFKEDGDSIFISFYADTIYGTVYIEEVI